MKFRKKPVVIDAWQLPPNDGAAWATIPKPHWIFAAMIQGTLYSEVPSEPFLMIKTLEGDMRAWVGDWIIRGVAGELYPCKPSIFAATYEPAYEP